MLRRVLLSASGVLAALIVVLPTATGGAHPGEAHEAGGKGLLSSMPSARQADAAAQLTRASNPRQAPLPAGPCTAEAAQSMPEGPNHNHAKIDQHPFQCRMEQVAFLSLRKELKDRPNVVLGEMDIKANIAAVAITYPQGGVLFFDVSDPSKPKFLSRYNATECDQLLEDINCGAFVDLSADGKTAYLSIQKLTLLPTLPLNPNVLNQSGPGVDVIDIANPRKPVRTQFYPILGLGGVHTVRSHTVPGGSTSGGPRRPGEYVISNQNGIGIDIARVSRVLGKRFLTTMRQVNLGNPLATIVNNEVHDTFIQNDPLDGRTYLYNAAGFATGFNVYDMTDPARIRQVAEWDLTPECDEDWYSHTIDVTHRNGHRYVTMPAEMFLSLDRGTGTGMAEQTPEDRAQGCGTFVGNGDKPGPLWIVDATDWSKLGPANDMKTPAEAAGTDRLLKENSRKALVATWTNPAGRAGGPLRFSPHNQQIVGDKIYLSHYHGGVYVLDAKAAFSGTPERPKELGFIVPHDPETRPLLGQTLNTGLLGRFFTDFPFGRPEVWDMVAYKGYVLAADMTGGLYSLSYDDSDLPYCKDSKRPRSSLKRSRSSIGAKRLVLRGVASDRGCKATAKTRKRKGSVRKMSASIARRDGTKCRFYTAKGKLSPARSCKKPIWIKARGRKRWRVVLKGSFESGSYRIGLRARDGAGNHQKLARITLKRK